MIFNYLIKYCIQKINKETILIFLESIYIYVPYLLIYFFKKALLSTKFVLVYFPFL